MGAYICIHGTSRSWNSFFQNTNPLEVPERPVFCLTHLKAQTWLFPDCFVSGDMNLFTLILQLIYGFIWRFVYQPWLQKHCMSVEKICGWCICLKRLAPIQSCSFHISLCVQTIAPNEFWLQTSQFFGSLGRLITYKKTYAGSLLSETLIEDRADSYHPILLKKVSLWANCRWRQICDKTVRWKMKSTLSLSSEFPVLFLK